MADSRLVANNAEVFATQSSVMKRGSHERGADADSFQAQEVRDILHATTGDDFNMRILDRKFGAKILGARAAAAADASQVQDD